MSFKEQLKRDIEKVFHNNNEFGEIKEIRYNQTYYDIPVVFDQEIAKDRKKPSSDHADGIFTVDARLYINADDIDFVPRHGSNIDVDESTYKIVKVTSELGEIILDLEMYSE